jgi:hypothetical protein
MKGLSLHVRNHARLLSYLALRGYLGSYPKVHFLLGHLEYLA